MKPIRNNRLSFKTIGQETIILDSKIGKEVHQLNEVATFVWNLCDGANEISSMADKLCDEFEVDYQTALVDVNELIAEFKSKSLIEEIP